MWLNTEKNCVNFNPINLIIMLNLTINIYLFIQCLNQILIALRVCRISHLLINYYSMRISTWLALMKMLQNFSRDINCCRKDTDDSTRAILLSFLFLSLSSSSSLSFLFLPLLDSQKGLLVRVDNFPFLISNFQIKSTLLK